jgi:cation:H+ antiporter
MVLVTVFLGPLIIDQSVGRIDGLLLTGFLVLYLIFVFYRGRKTPAHLISPVTQLTARAKERKRLGVLADLGLLVAGTLGLLLGGRAIVESGIYLSEVFGISELVIGLTVVAVGTSLPELATSIMAAVRRQTDIAVGNVIGSNIFNIAGVLGVTGLLAPIDVDPGVLWIEFPAVVGLSLVLFMVSFSPAARGKSMVQRWEGALLLVAYVALGVWILR